MTRIEFLMFPKVNLFHKLIKQLEDMATHASLHATGPPQRFKL